jgi:hypothetical protein
MSANALAKALSVPDAEINNAKRIAQEASPAAA